MGSQILQFDYCRITKLPLDVQLVLNHVRRAPVVLVGQHVRGRDTNQWRSDAARIRDDSKITLQIR